MNFRSLTSSKSFDVFSFSFRTARDIPLFSYSLLEEVHLVQFAMVILVETWHEIDSHYLRKSLVCPWRDVVLSVRLYIVEEESAGQQADAHEEQ